MDWFLYDNGLRHKRVKPILTVLLSVLLKDCTNVAKVNDLILNLMILKHSPELTTQYPIVRAYNTISTMYLYIGIQF